MGVSLAVAPLAAHAQVRPQPLSETAHSRRVQYTDESRQLAHVLGGAHYLRVLCVGKADQSWRQHMAAMIDREGGQRRSDLVDAFNAGYRDIELRFPSCSPAAQGFEAELKTQGLRLADTLSARHAD